MHFITEGDAFETRSDEEQKKAQNLGLVFVSLHTNNPTGLLYCFISLLELLFLNLPQKTTHEVASSFPGSLFLTFRFNPIQVKQIGLDYL